MAVASANGIQIAYEAAGSPGGETVLFIAGHGAQLTAVPDTLVAALVDRGFRVIRFDNRDVGLSTWFGDRGAPDFEAIRAAIAEGRPPPVAYTLSDMALDAVGLLDALGVARAHVFGGSMGGMIAQLVAADHGDRVASLVSFISTSGNPDLPPARPEAIEVLSTPADLPGDIAALVEQHVQIFKVLGSPAYPTPEPILRERAERDLRRAHNADGVARQSAAILATGDRRARLRRIGAPTLVLHGQDDPLLTVEGAFDTAACIPGAELRIIHGLGHDFPDALVPLVANEIARLAGARRA